MGKPHLVSYSTAKYRIWLCYECRSDRASKFHRLAKSSGFTPFQAYQRYMASLKE